MARGKQRPTHFLSVPLNMTPFKQNFNQFKEEILGGPPIYGLDVSLFNLSSKIHLTIGMLSLMDKMDREIAAQLLLDGHVESIVKYDRV